MRGVAGQRNARSMSNSEEHKATVRACFQAGAAGNLDALDAIIDPGFVLVLVKGSHRSEGADNHDVVDVERALDREQPVARFVLLADADRLVGGAVELLAHRPGALVLAAGAGRLRLVGRT